LSFLTTVQSQEKVRPANSNRSTQDIRDNLAPDLQTLLALQQLAGNAAVQQLMQRVRNPTVQREGLPGVSYPPPLTGKHRALYERKLKDVIPMLSHLQFRGTGPPKFDPDFWYLDKDLETGKTALVLKRNAEPAPAIKALIEKPGKWAVDCAMWVQIAELYALGSAVGFERFNKLATPWRRQLEFVLRFHGSTGVRRQFQWTRNSASGPVERKDERGRSQPEKRKMEDIVDKAPVGSRVAWTAKLIPHSERSHENAIKTGRDQYAAHGFEPKTLFTRKEMEDELFKLTKKEVSRPRQYLTEVPSDSDIKNSVFLSEVEEFQVP
jgi:hypothetical protein